MNLAVFHLREASCVLDRIGQMVHKGSFPAGSNRRVIGTTSPVILSRTEDSTWLLGWGPDGKPREAILPTPPPYFLPFLGSEQGVIGISRHQIVMITTEESTSFSSPGWVEVLGADETGQVWCAGMVDKSRMRIGRLVGGQVDDVVQFVLPRTSSLRQWAVRQTMAIQALLIRRGIFLVLMQDESPDNSSGLSVSVVGGEIRMHEFGGRQLSRAQEASGLHVGVPDGVLYVDSTGHVTLMGIPSARDVCRLLDLHLDLVTDYRPAWLDGEIFILLAGHNGSDRNAYLLASSPSSNVRLVRTVPGCDSVEWFGCEPQPVGLVGPFA